jgi:hypothetical protein
LRSSADRFRSRSHSIADTMSNHATEKQSAAWRPGDAGIWSPGRRLLGRHHCARWLWANPPISSAECMRPSGSATERNCRLQAR